jgi:hypothetical protein
VHIEKTSQLKPRKKILCEPPQEKAKILSEQRQRVGLLFIIISCLGRRACFLCRKSLRSKFGELLVW